MSKIKYFPNVAGGKTDLRYVEGKNIISVKFKNGAEVESQSNIILRLEMKFTYVPTYLLYSW